MIEKMVMLESQMDALYPFMNETRESPQEDDLSPLNNENQPDENDR